jgi:uncharacterized membrane protein
MITIPQGSRFFGRTRDNKADRPLIRPGLEPIDWLIEIAAILGLLTVIGFAIYMYPKLPESIPSHFDDKGMVDDYSGKDSFWALPAISAFIFILMSFIAMIPHRYNFTVKITPANAMRQYTMAMRLVRYMKAAIVWLFFYINYQTASVAHGLSSGLGPWFLPVTLGGMVLPILIYILAASRFR